ncbi:dihydropteroate synthase [Candidatus Pelagibacter sp.]|nr:dihydropteroate synthase [Candidatus Pelagibacter sp.]
MNKYYTRACNFYYGTVSKKYLKKKKSIPLNGYSHISFDEIEIINRKKTKVIKVKDIKKLPNNLKIKVIKDLKNITKKKILNKLRSSDIPILMGIINLTPDSFSDGGKYNKNNLAKKRVNSLLLSGAKIIDVGGESTRPGAIDIQPIKEWNRIKFILKNLKNKKNYISLDTRKSFVMEKASKIKIDLINDVSGLTYDPETINFLKKTKKPFVIHHMKGTPKNMQIKPAYKNVLLDIYDFFETKLKYLRKQGIKHNNIILDPGIGFGKNLKHNITLLKNISIFHSLGLPIMLGLSRKRFIKDISKENDTKDRIGGTISSCIQAYLQGVQILRVHDVKEINQAFKVFRELQN